MPEINVGYTINYILGSVVTYYIFFRKKKKEKPPYFNLEYLKYMITYMYYLGINEASKQPYVIPKEPLSDEDLNKFAYFHRNIFRDTAIAMQSNLLKENVGDKAPNEGTKQAHNR